jgi:hypothetical protein
VRLLSDDDQGLEIREEDPDSGVALAVLHMMSKGADEVQLLDSDETLLIRWTVMERKEGGYPTKIASELGFTEGGDEEILYPE